MTLAPNASVDQLKGAPKFRVYDPHPSGTVIVYEQPRPDQTYCAGADFAYGLEGRDLDVLVVMNNSQRPVREAAVAFGHWGSNFVKVIYALCRHFDDAFLVGERQVGLLALQQLYRDYGYRRLFYQRDESGKNRPVTEKLGWHRTTDDPTLHRLRAAVRERQIELKTPQLLDQMTMMEFYNETEIKQSVRKRDEDLKVRLTTGGSPDLVMALCYAWLACCEVTHYPAPPKPLPPDSLGAMFGYNEALGLTPKPPPQWR